MHKQKHESNLLLVTVTSGCASASGQVIFQAQGRIGFRGMFFSVCCSLHFVPHPVIPKKSRLVTIKWIICIWVCKQIANGTEHLGDGEGGSPSILQDVETECPIRTDITVVNRGMKAKFRWLERVVLRKVYCEQPASPTVRRWQFAQCGFPRQQIVRTDKHLTARYLLPGAKVLEFFQDSPLCMFWDVNPACYHGR